MTDPSQLSPTRFVIRQDDSESWKDSWARYRGHLAGRRLSDAGDLRKFFAYDFFHDGDIKDLRIAPGGDVAEFRIMACYLEDTASSHFSAWFKVTVHDVVWLSICNHQIWHPANALTYRYCEVDTLTEAITAMNEKFKGQFLGALKEELWGDEVDTLKDDEIRRELEDMGFHSLLIETVSPGGLLGFVFRHIDVLPEEPLAWELALKHGWIRPPYEDSPPAQQGA